MDNFAAAAYTSKKRKLYEIYSGYEKDALGYKENAVCGKGCSFCCTFMGNVDITTLEAVIIHERLNFFSAGERSFLSSRIEVNKIEKERGKNSPCPFVDEQGACSIYEVRPFSCRQLYSLKRCDGKGATIHRQAYELSREAIAGIQKLDDTGYSGHLTFILHLVEEGQFRKLYLAGEFAPDKISDFGRSHGIVINRRAQATG